MYNAKQWTLYKLNTFPTTQTVQIWVDLIASYFYTGKYMFVTHYIDWLAFKGF